MTCKCGSIAFLLLPLLAVNTVCFDEGGSIIEHQWNRGLIGKFSITPGAHLSKGWSMIVTFSQPIQKLEVWQAKLQTNNKKKTVFVLRNQHWNKELDQDQKFEFNFKATKIGRGNPRIIEVTVGRAEDMEGLSCRS